MRGLAYLGNLLFPLVFQRTTDDFGASQDQILNYPHEVVLESLEQAWVTDPADPRWWGAYLVPHSSMRKWGLLWGERGGTNCGGRESCEYNDDDVVCVCVLVCDSVWGVVVVWWGMV
jgi:hypothetical protein